MKKLLLIALTLLFATCFIIAACDNDNGGETQTPQSSALSVVSDSTGAISAASSTEPAQSGATDTQSGINGGSQSDESGSSAEPVHTHEYTFVGFVWEGYAAQAKYVCAEDNDTVLYAAIVTERVASEPSCTESGEKVYTATYDGHTETKTEELAATGHNLVNGVCSNCGYVMTTSVDEYFTFTQLSDGTYSIEAKDKSNLPSVIALPSTYNGAAVTSIGNQAFYHCRSLTSITIPDGVTSIGGYAFYYCRSLTSITIPDSVTSIGECAFYDCESLTSVTIGNGATSIGDHAFYNCFRLIEVYNKSALNITAVSSDYGYVGYYAKNVYTPTRGGSKLSTNENGYILYTDGDSVSLIGYTGNEEELVLPDHITDINQYAFEYCRSLTSISIPDSVTSIGNFAFEYCGGLTSVTIGDSVTSIGEGAFWNCSSLTSVTIGNSVTSIGYGAFYNCSSLTNVTIPNSVTSIGSSAFYKCSSLTSVTIGNGVTSICNCAFEDCDSLTSVYYNGDITGWCNISFDGYYSNPLCYAHNLYIKENGEYRLATDIAIPDSVTSIGSSAFSGCSSLTSVTIGNGVTSIGDYAFSGCSGLTSVYYDGDIAGWCNISFTDIWSNPLFYAHNLYIKENGEYRLATDIAISDGVTSIGSYAFYGCSSLTSVTIGDSVTSIGSYAFYGCSSLTSVTIGDSVTSIGSSAFWACSSLTSVTFGENSKLESIGGYAFIGCSSLTSVTIGDGVTSIGSSAFYDCDSLTSVTFKNTSGWFVSYDSSATSGRNVDVTNASQNATYLKSTYYDYYWKRK